MRDIDLFYEKRMNADYLGDFLKALRYSLREELKNNIFKKEGYDMVLQGYRGPSHMCNGDSGDSETIHGPINGVQEIQARWELSKTVNYVPLAFIYYFIRKISDDIKNLTDWFTFYFDAKTGEYLSHSVENVADKLNEKAVELLKAKKYSEAEEYFKNAIGFANNKIRWFNLKEGIINMANKELNAINLKNEGDDFFNQERYTEAKAKYRKAYDVSTFNYHTYSENENKAEAEEQAMLLNNRGDYLFKQKNYTEAKTKYEEALTKSVVKKDTYQKNKNKAVVEIEANQLNHQGNDFFNWGRYTEAKAKYQKAYDVSMFNYNEYRENVNKAEAELEAIQFNNQGDDLFNQEKYTEAKTKYQEALNKSVVKKEKYTENLRKAEAELEAIQFNNQGDDLFMQNNYIEAKTKYEEAWNKSVIKKDKYRENKKKAIVEIEANQLNNQGDYLFSQGKFTEARTKYQEAYNKTNIHKNTFESNIRKATIEVEAVNLNQEGDQEFAKESYKQALQKYDEAYAKTQINSQKEDFAKNKEKVEKKLQSIIENLWISGKKAEDDVLFEEAKRIFQNALNLSQEYSIIFPNNSDLKLYVSMTSLKLEGSDIFEDGADLSLRGFKLWSEAENVYELKKYNEADAKFKEAKSKLEEAQRKFEEGQEVDKRFTEIVQFIKVEIDLIDSKLGCIENLIADQQKQSDRDIRVSATKQEEQQQPKIQES